MRTVGLASLAIVVACAPATAGSGSRDLGGDVARASRTAAANEGGAAGEPAIAFIEDDYPRALAEARARGLPLFVDAWAPWCHTCLSMRSYVFPDPALHRVARRFVWLSIDTEREQNAAIVARLDTQVLPTLYVIEPSDEKAVLAWPGSLTAGELATLLDETDLAPARGDTGGTAAVALLRARRASAAGKSAEAVAAYREALSMVPPGTPTHAEAVDGLVTALANDGNAAACVVTANKEAPRMRPGTAVADVVRAGIGCVFALPSHSPEPRRLGELAAIGERIASDASQPILADDRSDLYDYVVQALQALGRPDDARRLARAWSAFLDEQAARAPTPGARAVFDAHRLVAYIAIGEAHRAVPMLERSERDFPGDYNPPARLATAYLEMKRYDEALDAAKRALLRGYGPRKLRLWLLEADVYAAAGDRRSERRAIEEALAYAKTIPLGAGSVAMRDALETRLAKVR